MVVIVPDPHTQPYKLIAAAVYTKNVSEQLSFAEMSAIFDNATKGMATGPAESTPNGDFRRVSDGQGKTLSICGVCYAHVAVAEDISELDKPEEHHRCDLATETEDSN